MFRRKEKVVEVKQDANGKPVAADLDFEEVDNEVFCSKHSFTFLVPPRSSLIELLVVLVLIPVYGFLATFLCHPETSSYNSYQLDIDEDE